MSDRHANATDRLDDAVAKVRDGVATDNKRLVEEIGRLEKLSRRVAVGGLHWEATGLFLVLLGLALQWIALTVR